MGHYFGWSEDEKEEYEVFQLATTTIPTTIPTSEL
jgi:hypothetical protein